MPPPSAFAIRAEPHIAGGEDRRIGLLLLTDTPVLAPGGSERFLQNLATGLPADQYRITLVQFNEHFMPDGPAQAQARLPNVRLLAQPVDAVYDRTGLRAWWRLATLLRRERFDIVQSQHEKADLINALLPRHTGSLHISNRRDMGFKKSARLQQLFRVLNARFDTVVAPARQILSGLARYEHLDGLRMTWIPNGVDTRRYSPASFQARQDARRALGIADPGDDGAVFGCVARMTPVKRHVDLLEAFAALHRTQPSSRLVLIGDGPLLGEVQARIAALGLGEAVTVVSFRDDVEALLPALDVLVLSSSSEGMSNAILEAMACGLPVIATAVGGNLHLVQHEATGVLVPPQDPISLTAAMQWLGHSPLVRRRMGAAARARIEREFSLDNMVLAFDQLYRRLLQRPPGAA